MFQKFIVALSFIAASATAFAGDTVKVMYVGIPQVGPAISFIQSYAKNLPIDSKFVSMKDCELAMKEVENSDDENNEAEVTEEAKEEQPKTAASRGRKGAAAKK